MGSYDDELKKTIADLGTAFEQFKTEHDTQLSKKVKDALAEIKIDKINEALNGLEAKKEELERKIAEERTHREEVERKLNRLRNGGLATDEEMQKHLGAFNLQVKELARSRGAETPADLSMEDFTAYKAAVSKWMRKGHSAMTPEEVKTMLVGSDADGGFLVMPDTNGRIITKIRDLDPIRSIANVQSIGTDALEGIEDLGDAGFGWVGETAARPDTDTPQVGKWRIEAHECYASPKATQKLLDDAMVNIEAWLGEKVSNRFARGQGDAFINGDGVGKPRGFATYVTAATADESRAWGQFEHVNTGANGAFHTTQADPLFDLEMAFKPAYLQNARWVTRRAVIAAIRKFKTSTTSEYIWQPGLQAGQPSTLLGYPIVIAQGMPAHTTTGALGMALGDFNAGYQIVDRIGVRVLRDPYTDKPYVKFYTTARVGGGAVNFDAIKFIRFAAS